MLMQVLEASAGQIVDLAKFLIVVSRRTCDVMMKIQVDVDSCGRISEK